MFKPAVAAMAELLSVQVHVPVTKSESGHLIEKTLVATRGGFTRLKKVDNVTQDRPGAAKFDYLPKRRAVNLEFKGLTYSVSEGRKKGMIHVYFFRCLDHAKLQNLSESCIFTRYTRITMSSLIQTPDCGIHE